MNECGAFSHFTISSQVLFLFLSTRQNNCVRDSKQPSSSSAQLKQPSCSETNVSSGYSWIPLNTGADGWIFVIRSGVLFAGEKRTKTFPRSFFPFNRVLILCLFYITDVKC